MEDTIDELQIIINEARKDLSKETREAIDNVNWKLTILKMVGKYNESQINELEIETELLLCGILAPDEYQKELENRMMLTGEQVNLLLEEMDKLIFKKIQSELEKILARQSIKTPEGRVITNNQLLITNEDISSKEEGEKITNDELRITNENTRNKEAEIIKNENTIEEDEVPKPPYEESIANDELRITNEAPKEMPISPVKLEENTKSDVFEDKLKGSVAGGNNVSEYSSKTPDPYREPF